MSIARFPRTSGNQHVTGKQVFLVLETFGLGDDTGETWFIDALGEPWHIGSGRNDQARPASMFHMCRLTGLRESDIMSMWEQWKEQSEGIAAPAKPELPAQ